MRFANLLRGIGAVLAASIFAACSSTGSTSVQCPAAGTVVAPPTMLYPVSGATGVPDGNFTLVLSAAYGQTLTLSPGNATLASASVPNPLPTPNATPPPGSTPVGFAVGVLSAHTTYTIYGNFASTMSGCPGISAAVGSFTTQ